MSHARPLCLLTALSLVLAPVSAQHLLRNQPGPFNGGRLGQLVAAAGDLDGDGVPDFFVSQPMDGNGGNNLGRVLSISGATLSTILTMQFGAPIIGMAVIGDVDGDGRNDLVVGFGGSLLSVQVRSGATGAAIRSHGTQANQAVAAACNVGDVDNDGRDDYALMTSVNNQFYVSVMSGRTGAQLNIVLSWSSSNVPERMFSLGDLNGNGSPEVAVVSTGYPIAIVSLNPPQLLRQIQPPSGANVSNFAESVALGDVNGDGHPDLAVSSRNYSPPGVANQGAVFVFSAVDGALLRTLMVPDRYDLRGSSLMGAVTNVGDLDRDHVDDFAVLDDGTNTFEPYRKVRFFSGGSGRLLTSWLGNAQTTLVDCRLAGIGDVDGDGYGDLVIGMSELGSSQQGLWQAVSCRPLATLRFWPVTCTGGPFVPQLGCTRPVLGQTVTIVGRDCPLNAHGTLALSQVPNQPVNLGAAGCDAWFDVANWVIAHNPPPGANWTLQLPIPAAPQLAGFDVALQAFYLPTNGPLGYDLSNAVWTKLGF